LIDFAIIARNVFVLEYPYLWNLFIPLRCINGLTPPEIFLQTFDRSHYRNNTKRKSVTYVGNWKCQLSM